VGVQHCQLITTTSKTDAKVYTEINFKNSSLRHPLWRKQRQKHYFCRLLIVAERPRSKNFGPEVPYQWLLLIENNTNMKNLCRRSEDIASLATFMMVSEVLNELDAVVLPENQ